MDLIDGKITDFKRSAKACAIVSSAFAENNWNTTAIAGVPLKLYTFDDTVEVMVAAVFRSFPENSHEDFNILISYDTTAIDDLNFDITETGVYGRTLSKRPEHFKFHNDKNSSYILQPITEIYFGPRITGEAARHGDRYSVNILICITLLILFLTVTTFVNLTTITLPYRAKELAVKKLAGTSRASLLVSFIRESALLVGLSLLVGVNAIFSRTIHRTCFRLFDHAENGSP
jgi:putative ABC transport system permease protein